MSCRSGSALGCAQAAESAGLIGVWAAERRPVTAERLEETVALLRRSAKSEGYDRVNAEINSFKKESASLRMCTRYGHADIETASHLLMNALE